MSTSKMVSQLYAESISNDKKNTLIKNINSNKNADTNIPVFNRNISAMVDRYKNLRGQDMKNWIDIQKNNLSTYHPFYSLYSQQPQNPTPDSKEFMEQAWDNYQYRYE